MGFALVGQILSTFLFSFLRNAMMKAEEKHPEPGSGAAKKAYVMDATDAVLDTIEQVSTGGQKASIGRNKEHISKVVDGMAGILFPKLD